jgi:GTPase SAR1 family protein
MLMIVGEENVGKTTLIRGLIHHWDPNSATTVSVRSVQRTGDTVSTDGVDITRCKFKYDFGKLKGKAGKEQINQVDVMMCDFAGVLIFF